MTEQSLRSLSPRREWQLSVDPKDVDTFLGYAKEENLEAVTVATVTESPRLVLTWRGKTIVDLSRAFLDTNGAHQETDVTLEVPNHEGTPFEKKEVGDVKEKWLKMLGSLNVCSQKGLVEMFDSSIGASTVMMPYGGNISRLRSRPWSPSFRFWKESATL